MIHLFCILTALNVFILAILLVVPWYLVFLTCLCVMISDFELLSMWLSEAAPLNSSLFSGSLIPSVNDRFPSPQLISF